MPNAVKDGAASPQQLLSVDRLAWAVMESMNDGLIVTDYNGHITYLNYAAERLLGVTFTQAFGRALTAVLTLIPLSHLKANACTPADNDLDINTPFRASRYNGTFQLQGKPETYIVDIKVSPLNEELNSNAGMLFVVRTLPDPHPLVQAFRRQSRGGTLVKQQEFHKRLRQCLKTAKEWPLEHGLLYLCLTPYESYTAEESHNGELNNAEVTRLILNRIRSRDTLCRFKTNEFVVLLENCQLTDATRTALKLIDCVRHQLSLGGWQANQFMLRTGVVSIPPNTSSNPDDLIAMAAMACEEAKQMNGHSLQVYEPEWNTDTQSGTSTSIHHS